MASGTLERGPTSSSRIDLEELGESRNTLRSLSTEESCPRHSANRSDGLARFWGGGGVTIGEGNHLATN